MPVVVVLPWAAEVGATDLQTAVGERGSLQEAKEWTKAEVRTGDSAEAPVL